MSHDQLSLPRRRQPLFKMWCTRNQRDKLLASIFRSFVRWNQIISRRVNNILPARLSADGNRTFLKEVVPLILRPGITIYDIGGGSQPCISSEQKAQFVINLVGFDISLEELDGAPTGLYDKKIVADICAYQGECEADVIVCQAVLEHVPNNSFSVAALSRILKPGGKLYVFVPCRNALYARLNIALPQKTKEKLLELFIPGSGDHQGFPAFYDRCTPRNLTAIAEASDLKVREVRLFWMSSYFMVLFPAFIFWRVFQLVAYLSIREDAAETFILIAEKAGRVGED